MKTIRVFGAEWCEDTHRTRAHLDALKEHYQYIDVDKDPAAEAWITQKNRGKRKTPTVDLNGEKILFEPTNEELNEALKEMKSLSP
jgi:glutaredoxin